MKMIIKYLETGGSVPVNVKVNVADGYIVIEWATAQLCLPIEEIREIVRDTDDLK